MKPPASLSPQCSSLDLLANAVNIFGCKRGFQIESNLTRRFVMADLS
jgi:hypothetical protein